MNRPMRVGGAAHNPYGNAVVEPAVVRLRMALGANCTFNAPDVRVALNEIERLREAMLEIRELIDGYVDVRDGANGPLPNKAMLAQQAIDEVLGIAP